MAINRSTKSVGILGIGHYLPGEPVTNETVAATAGVDIDWITSRTGIQSRHYAPPEMKTSDLATEAARRAIASAPAGLPPDLIVLGTGSPDSPAPATASYVQDNLGLTGVPAFDVNSSCSGFLSALASATGMFGAGIVARPVVIGADTFSRCIDPADRKTAPLFGDGAAAVQLGEVPDGYGILALDLWADGSKAEYAYTPEHGEYFRMNGRGVKNVVMEMGPKLLNSALAKAGVRLEQLNRVLVHQANPKLVTWLSESLGVDSDVMPTYGRFTGNTATSSAPLALSLAHEERPFRDGDLLAVLSVGAGMSAGAAVVRWYEPKDS